MASGLNSSIPEQAKRLILAIDHCPPAAQPSSRCQLPGNATFRESRTEIGVVREDRAVGHLEVLVRSDAYDPYWLNCIGFSRTAVSTLAAVRVTRYKRIALVP